MSKENMIYGNMLSVEIKFSEWLSEELKKRGMTQSQLARKAGLNRGTISNIVNENRGVGEDTLKAIAIGLKLPPDMVFRAAGLLPENHNDDSISSEAIHLLNLLSSSRKRQAVDFIRYLVQEEEADKPRK